jgi:hypothetical protein
VKPFDSWAGQGEHGRATWRVHAEHGSVQEVVVQVAALELLVLGRYDRDDEAVRLDTARLDATRLDYDADIVLSQQREKQ